MLRITTVAILLAVTLPAMADDGAYEIDQACVATGCFVGDDPGLPVQITNPGSYQLTSAIEVENDVSALTIDADLVTLDLNGFTIQGPVACSGRPVTSCSGSHSGFGIFVSNGTPEIRNGRVSGFDEGIRCQDGCSALNLRIDNNSGMGINSAVAGNDWGLQIHGSIIEANGNIGARSQGDGSLIVNSSFRHNGGRGLESSDGGGVFRNNTVENNGNFARVNADWLLTGNHFRETAGGSPFTGGVSAGDNLCNGTLC